MDHVKKISRNIFIQGAAEVAVKGLQILILIYIARFLRQTEFGKFNFAIAFTTVALIFVDIGLQPLFVRDISRKSELAEKYIFHSIIIKSVLSVVAFIAVIFILNFMSYPKDIRIVVYIMFLFAILKSFTDTFSSIFLAFEKMEWDGFLKIIRAVLLAILVFYALFGGYGLVTIAWMYVVAEIIVLSSALFILFSKFIRFKAKLEKSLAKKLVIEALPFALTVLFYSIYFYIDSIMLSKMRGVYEVGIYSAAYNITIALIFIPSIYITAIFPSLSRFYINSLESLKFAYRKSLKYISIIALPITIILLFAGSNIIHFLYGTGYDKSAIVLQIVAVTIFFRFVTFVNAITIVSMDRQNQRTLFQGITAAINILLNFFLIQRYGYVGAAIATIVTELFLFASYFFLIMRLFKNWEYLSVMIRPIIAAALASLLFFIGFNTYLKIILVVFAYGAFLTILKTFEKDDWGIFRRILAFNWS